MDLSINFLSVCYTPIETNAEQEMCYPFLIYVVEPLSQKVFLICVVLSLFQKVHHVSIHVVHCLS